MNSWRDVSHIHKIEVHAHSWEGVEVEMRRKYSEMGASWTVEMVIKPNVTLKMTFAGTENKSEIQRTCSRVAMAVQFALRDEP